MTKRTRYTFAIFPLMLLSAVVSAGDELPWFPIELLYPTYLADPYALGFHLQLRSYDESTIPETGSLRWDGMVAAPLIIYEKKEPDNTDHGWQFIFMGGLRGQFDTENSHDNIAWEGLLGLQGVFRYHDNFAWHFGTKHYSSHIGDEYIERTGRTRIGYTRNELRAGFAWDFSERYMFYSDIADAVALPDNTFQDNLRAQAGLQYEKPGVFLDGKAGWYSALDISAYEEDDWDTNITFQIGFDLRSHDRRWRLELEYYDGRSQYGEFFQYRDKYTSIGVMMDL